LLQPGVVCAGVEQVGAKRGPPTTAQITKPLTGAVLEFARTVLGPDCRPYRELRLPVVPDGKNRYSRADVVIWAPALSDLVIETPPPTPRPRRSSSSPATLAPSRCGCASVPAASKRSTA
jgi:hypothetical protein